jgi:hypothetical protein
MNIKLKKQISNKIVRLETSGEIKEILINEDIFNPKDAQIQVCFRGENNSGIVELSKKELESIYADAMKKAGLAKSAKVIKFKK